MAEVLTAADRHVIGEAVLWVTMPGDRRRAEADDRGADECCS